MKILFISSGNNRLGISPIIYNQGESLKKINCEISYFTINKKGVFGYLYNIIRLRKHLKRYQYDIVHAHYSFCGFVATFAGAKPLVVSLMGSDIIESSFFRQITIFFIKKIWKETIVKSDEMKKMLSINTIHVIPNGVNFEQFKPINKEIALDKLNWDKTKKHILFAADPKRKEKNYKLTELAFAELNRKDICLQSLNNVDNSLMPYLYNAADVIVLSSFHEGSPNVIKEAMACNKSIVSTNIGDVKTLIHGVKGCYLADFNILDFSTKLSQAIEFNKPTEGRNHINHLKSETIANEIISLYKKHIK